jgi:hypothetical protein
MEAHGRRHLFIRRRGKIITNDCLRRDDCLFVQTAANQYLFSSPGTHGRVADAEEYDANLLDHVILELCKNAGADKSEIAAPSRQFMKRPPVTGTDHRNMNRDQQLAGL